MGKRYLLLKRFFLLIIVSALCLTSISCRSNAEEIFITWLDTDGTLIESQSATKDFNPTQRHLPDDSDLWHYTEWTVSQSGNVIVCTAKRVSKSHILWKDSDGSILKETFITENDAIPSFDLPQSSEKWTYENWVQSSDGKQIVFQAQKKPNTQFFIGNVFQIVVRDKQGKPLGTGSGFVINDEGWFITNNHVMESGYSAMAYFDIKDSENGEQYTRLNVLGGVYNNEEKDIFIGKLEGYNKIKEHYHSIDFTEEYLVGEPSYSVGYPNSSTTIEINSGTILEEYSDIYSKIDGIFYVLSDSYIAPGSSGGILVNENFEVIGITSMGLYSDSNKNDYISGGSIPYLLFKQNLKNLRESDIKSISYIYNNGF